MLRPEALATAATVLTTVGLAVLVAMTGLLAVRWSLQGRARDPGGGRPEPVPIRPLGEPDADLFRILGDARLGDLRLSQRAQRRGRRRGTV